MATASYPVRVDATKQPDLSRALWLVKWLLAIPHYVILFFLWLAFGVLSIAAFFAILFTGRYPRRIFDFNVGVLRWNWRVAYYAYGALGTDRYPPFTLEEVPDYPAHLEIAYPERLSRGLVLVKTWLLAIPHYLVVSLFVGGGLYAVGSAAGDTTPLVSGGGLISLLVLFAAIALLFTGRYPGTIFDLVLGLNRWVIRVAAYASLMTDDYPPFRLDQGPQDPGSARLAVSPTSPVPPVERAEAAGSNPADTGQTPGAAPGPPPSGQTHRWTTGRIVAVVFGSISALLAFSLLLAGIVLAVGQTLRDDDGFFMSGDESVATSTYAVASETFELHAGSVGSRIPDSIIGDVRVRATSQGDGGVFVGIASESDAAAYLDGVEHTTVVDVRNIDGETTPVYRDSAGSAPSSDPAELGIWEAQASGNGTQTLTWEPDSGDWVAVVMNADRGAGVSADVAVGAEIPAVGWVVAALLIAGLCFLLIALALLLGALRGTSTSVSSGRRQ